jgi:hypothetical protein
LPAHTNETRRLRLIRYRYAKTADEPNESAGVGLVGSITFSLFSETTADMPPEDVYALHCCWELETNQDPRAPQKRSASAGRTLLGI